MSELWHGTIEGEREAIIVTLTNDGTVCHIRLHAVFVKVVCFTRQLKHKTNYAD